METSSRLAEEDDELVAVRLEACNEMFANRMAHPIRHTSIPRLSLLVS